MKRIPMILLAAAAFLIRVWNYRFLWCHKYGTLSKTGMIASMIARLIPCVDVIGSILRYIMFRKEGQSIKQ